MSAHVLLESKPVFRQRQTLFLARCSCGWKSDPVAVDLIRDEWADHLQEEVA